MATFKKGSFSINLGIAQVGGEFEQYDRQCAWELYTEIITRRAVRGREGRSGRESFEGELYHESLQSMYNFFLEARQIMKRYPVGAIGREKDDHLGFLIVQLLEYVIRPFLEKWQGNLRYYHAQKPECVAAAHWQTDYPNCEELQKDWTEVRKFARSFASELAQAYGFFDVTKDIPDRYGQIWQEEHEALK